MHRRRWRTDRSRGPRSRTQRADGRALGTAALALLAGCQSYEPRPLDSPAHRAAWHARTVEASSVRSFLEELGRAEPGAELDFDPSDGLVLEEAWLVALAFAPRLRVARLEAERVAAGAAHAGLWADPELALSVTRVTESVPDPWVIHGAVPFSIPLSGRLGAEKDLASAEARAAARRVVETEWALRRELRDLWYAWSAARLRAEETERFVASVEELVRGATDLAERGELRATEAALFALERSRRANDLRRMRGEVAALEQELRSLVGLAPDAPVSFVEELRVDEEAELALAGAEELAHRNPTLARLREEYDAAEERLRLEVARQYPDLVLGPQLEEDEGQTRIGMIAGIPLPVFNANRRAIAEARVGRELARAAHETGYELLVGRWAAARARLRALEEQRADLETVLAPMVDRQLEAAVRLARLGEGSSLVLLESLVRAQDTRLEGIDVRAEEASARAELAFLFGPPLAAPPAEEKEQSR